jgi:hypothetical protein
MLASKKVPEGFKGSRRFQASKKALEGSRRIALTMIRISNTKPSYLYMFVG